MKTIIFVVAGLAIGTLGGTAFGGLKEKKVLVAQLEAEKAALAASHEASPDPAADGHGAEVSQEDMATPADSAEAHAEEAAHEAVAPDQGVQVDQNEPSADNPSPATQAGAHATEETPVGTHTEDAPAVHAPEVPGPAGATQPPSDEGRGSQRLAKIFGAMKAPDAAKVLQNLDDEEVSAILFHLTDRKAAEILGNFAPERAATLSRLVLGSPGGEGS